MFLNRFGNRVIYSDSETFNTHTEFKLVQYQVLPHLPGWSESRIKQGSNAWMLLWGTVVKYSSTVSLRPPHDNTALCRSLDLCVVQVILLIFQLNSHYSVKHNLESHVNNERVLLSPKGRRQSGLSFRHDNVSILFISTPCRRK